MIDVLPWRRQSEEYAHMKQGSPLRHLLHESGIKVKAQCVSPEQLPPAERTALLPRVLFYDYVALKRVSWKRARTRHARYRTHKLLCENKAHSAATRRLRPKCAISAQPRDRNRYVRRNKNVRAVRNNDTRPKMVDKLSPHRTNHARSELVPIADNTNSAIK